MNSITKHLDFNNIVATMRLLRSGRNNIIFVVEGAKDASLFGNIFKISQSDILVCRGKDALMELYDKKLADPGFFFFRDRDAFECISREVDGRHIFVSDRYDFEADLLISRIGMRMVLEYARGTLDWSAASRSLKLVVSAASWIGAVRHLNYINKSILKFEGINLSFINPKDMSVDAKRMFANLKNKSGCSSSDLGFDLLSIQAFHESHVEEDISCGKDMLYIFQILFYKHHRFCKSVECCYEVLDRTLRIAANLSDFRCLSFYDSLKDAICGSTYVWSGVEL